MQNYPKVSGPKQSLLLLAGTAVGVSFTLVIIPSGLLAPPPWPVPWAWPP
jgi:hypothetical protein